MPRSKRSVSLRVESMESRALLSGVLPVLTVQTYDTVIADVKNVMGTLAKTHNFSAAQHSLTQLSFKIPFGGQQLSPTWIADLGIYSAQVPRSGLAMQNQILVDLNQYIEAGVTAGTFRFAGSGSSAFNRVGVGAPAVSAASVTIVNNTGLNITVVASLNGAMQRITKSISIGGKALFDFQSNSSNFISVNISRTDGQQPPPPLSVGLNRPVSGYFGTSYPISVFANVFSVGQG